MQPVVRPLFLLHSDPALRHALGRIPGQPYILSLVSNWEALQDGLRRAPPTALVVADPRGESEEGGLTCALAELLRTYPSATVLAALPVAPEDAELVLRLREWGVADVIDLARERTPEALERRLRVVQGRAVRRLLQRALPPNVPGRTRTLLAAAAEVVSRGGQSPEFAASLQVTERTVARWCERADLPPPRRLLAWMRILLATELLDDAGRSLESTARACGYSGAGSLKPALRNFLNRSARELREAGAFATAVQVFREEMDQIREAGRSVKPAKVWLN
ncbi:MAG: helix-turn-helix domain-containing protein [Gemmatimonadota bacterium]